MPRFHRRRRWLPLSVLAAATATVTLAGAVPAGAAPVSGPAQRPAAAGAKTTSPTPAGKTKAPASTPVKSADAGQPLVKTAADPGFRPFGLGQVPWSEFWSAQLSDAVSAQVNYGSGNLLVSVEEFGVADAGPGLSLGHVHNSLNGVGWQATTGTDHHVREVTPNAVYVQGPSGTVAVFERDGSGFIPAAGYRQDLTQSADKKSFTLTSRENGQKTTFSRSGTSGLAHVTKVEDRNGNATTVSYSGGFTSKITSASGRTLTFAHDGDHITKVTDNAGRSVSYTYTGDDLTSVTDTEGKTTRFAHDGSGRLTKITTPEGRQTTFTWDSTRVASVTRVVNTSSGEGNTTAFRWILPPATGGEGVVRVTDPRGHHTLKAVDHRWRVRETEDPLGRTRSKSWGPDNNVLTAVDAMGATPGDGNVTSFSYDDAFNPTSATIPTGAQASMSWVERSGGQYPQTLTSASDEKISNAYDTSGNLLSRTDSTSGGTEAEWSYRYNPEDGEMDCGGLPGQRCSATDPRGKKTTFAYDDQGNLTKVTPPSPQKPVSYTYDALGRTKTTTDGRGVTTTYGYDHRDRVTSQEAGGQTASFTYDDDGNLTTRRTPAGTSAFSYDEQNRERSRTLPAGGTTSVTYDENGNTATVTDAGGTTRYAYDEANQLTTLTEAGGAETTYAYDDNGKRTRTTYPGGTTQSVTVDDSGRVTRIKAANGSTTFSTLEYDYTRSGEDTDKIRERTADGAATAYSYDTQGRLTKAVETEDGETTAGWSYCYDKAGNRTGSSTGAGLPGSCADAEHSYTYNDAGELTSYDGDDTFAYDGAGNETAAASPAGARTGATWSPFTQLTRLSAGGESTTASYAGVDNTDRLTRSGTTFTQTALGLTRETGGSGQATGFVREPSGNLTAMRSGGTSHYYLTDVQGSVIGLVDASGERTAGYSYGPYGEPRTATGPQSTQPYRYTGTYLDPTGLYKMGHRYYDPHLGRFTQPDPSGQETNPYLYASGDCVNRTDPTGLFSFSDVFDTGSDIFGVVTGCLGGIGAAAETGAITYASAVGGVVGAGVGSAVGAGAAVVGSCALGGVAGYYGADIITYG
ncbi:hypothetical protein HCK00_18725 [Streptomyces sp. PLAI1-29]|uniref:Teneurin-like YD-shell domain-containing protein n=1 Tax=Streptomyces zingiberis TaxID=2053010 RepID=A0ABX1BXU4_9ACTN|nr:hypothetical protein [Streptomyces zingiberis]